MNALRRLNEQRRADFERVRDQLDAARAERRAQGRPSHPLAALRELLARVIGRELGREAPVLHVSSIDRSRFGGDIAVRVLDLLQEAGHGDYVRTHVPRLAAALRAPDLAGVVASVEAKGLYVNLRLEDRWLVSALGAVVDSESAFGENDAERDRSFVIDYSSPNVAKVLHAGHIRSTIVGHVLANLHEACGARVYRVNHINDFGGFGFLLEGYRRFADRFPPTMGPNERLLEIYAIRRALERTVAEGAPESDADVALVERYLPEARGRAARQAAFAAFTRAADERFARLEAGDAEEVSLWTTMVAASLAEFQRFYDALGIHIDFTIGESFYFDAGNAIVERALAAGTATVFTEAERAEVAARIEERVRAGAMTPDEAERAHEAARKDLGAVVVVVGEDERYVVRRADGRSIYATRDLGAVEVRQAFFHPTDVVYVVGQEQQVHFTRLFAAVRRLGLAPADTRFRHVYFGFYVDAKTRKKLSSRESVANVYTLLESSVAYFRARCAETPGQTEEELQTAAQELAVGSLVFNDLKQDMKGTVEIETRNLQATVESFERSGGAYVVYSACRARGILRRLVRPVPSVEEVPAGELSGQEVGLTLRILELPDRVQRAADEENPSVLVRWLLDFAMEYNAYYNAAPVLKGGGEPNLFRVLLTRAVELALTNGLRFCHISCPARI